MNKVKLRHHMLQELNHLPLSEKQNIESAMHQRLWKSSLWRNADIIGLTYAQNFEWNTYPLIKKAWSQHKTVVIPKTDAKHRKLDFYIVEHIEQLQSGYADIMEPNPAICEPMPPHAIQLMIVPGIVFNKEGYRIGFGGGYYDRFLADYIGLTVSLVSNMQLIHPLPIEEFDIPVQYLITETICYSTTEE